jgi:serine/threonine-protein phosphatase 6 regulatory ankyrin repeat subunit B
MNSEEKNSLLAENEKLKELTDREWISKIVQMPRNANDVVILQELKKEWSELLIQTVEFAKYKIVQQVLNGKDSEGNQLVDINFQNEQGYTALSIAAKIGDDEKIALLLKNGANIELAKEEKISKKESKKLEEIYQQVKKATEDLVSAIVMGNNLRVKKLLNTTPVDVNMTVMIPIYGMGPSSPLMYAVNEGNIELVELLLKHPNININVRDNAGRTALIYAVSITYDTKKLLLDTPGVKEFLESLQQPIVKLLLKHPKIDVNALDHNKRTALQYAESFNDIKTIKLLLDHPDIDVNLQDNMGNTILMRMAFSGAKDIVELLLKVPNIEINKRNRVGTTALIIAASQGQRKIVQLLLNQPDIDINTQEEEGLSALCAAIRYGYKKVAELLLKHPKCDVNLQVVNGWNALMYASCKIDNKEILELLLNHPDINLNQINKSGFTALMIASNNNQSEIVKLLLSHPDIDLNIQGIYGRGYSVLIYEACIGHKEIVELLLKNPSININLQDNQGTTALIHAIINDHEEIVELLLKQPSIDINLQDKNGGTALIWAASGGHTKSVELLLQQPNIDINKRDLQGNIALSYTVTRNHKEILEQLLKQSNVDLKTLRAALITAICKGYIEIVELLLKQPDIDINDEYVEAIIIIFGMATGNENIIKLFIDKGLNVNKKFFGGEVTLLMLAIQFGFYRIINLLLKQPGIDINIKDGNGETAFDYAQRNGRIKIIK